MPSPSTIKQATEDNNDAEVVRIGYGPPPQLPPVVMDASLKQDDESGDGELQKKSDARRQSEGFVAFNKGFDDW